MIDRIIKILQLIHAPHPALLSLFRVSPHLLGRIQRCGNASIVMLFFHLNPICFLGLRSMNHRIISTSLQPGGNFLYRGRVEGGKSVVLPSAIRGTTVFTVRTAGTSPVGMHFRTILIHCATCPRPLKAILEKSTLNSASSTVSVIAQGIGYSTHCSRSHQPGQTQVPPMQGKKPGHAVPQPPQLYSSVWVSDTVPIAVGLTRRAT